MKAMRPKAMAAFVAAEDSAAARPPPPPASRGIATKSGTTARSWYSDRAGQQQQWHTEKRRHRRGRQPRKGNQKHSKMSEGGREERMERNEKKLEKKKQDTKAGAVKQHRKQTRPSYVPTKYIYSPR